MSFDLHPFVPILTLGVAVAFFVMVFAGIKRGGIIAQGIELTKRSVWTWLGSVPSVVLALMVFLLAVHGWLLGESASISENTGPPLFELHFVVMGVVALLATWLAFPIWLLLLCF